MKPADVQAAQRVLRHSRREAIIVAVVWALALLWTVGYCYLFGYQHEPASWAVQWGLANPRTVDNFNHLWGFPDWMLIAIILPWLLCTAFTILFGTRIMSDDDLGGEAEPAEGAGHGH